MIGNAMIYPFARIADLLRWVTGRPLLSRKTANVYVGCHLVVLAGSLLLVIERTPSNPGYGALTAASAALTALWMRWVLEALTDDVKLMESLPQDVLVKPNSTVRFWWITTSFWALWLPVDVAVADTLGGWLDVVMRTLPFAIISVCLALVYTPSPKGNARQTAKKLAARARKALAPAGGGLAPVGA